jgi:hypothetical protein
MIIPPLSAYGFTYRYCGREFATHIEAASAEEAIDHIRAMARAELVGKLVPAVSVQRELSAQQVTDS